MSECMSGTRGSGVLSSTGDVLVRGVGGVCDMCMCLARGGVGGEGGEWMRELGLGFTNPLGTGGVLDMCLCFGCGGVGGVGGEWVGGLDRGRERWGGVMYFLDFKSGQNKDGNLFFSFFSMFNLCYCILFSILFYSGIIFKLYPPPCPCCIP